MCSEHECKQFAATFLELAKRATEPVDKSHLVVMAEAWLDLADRTARLADDRVCTKRPLVRETFARPRMSPPLPVSG
jgi:hypothetical protein